MATTKNRHQRRAAQAQGRKNRSGNGSGQPSRSANENLLLRLAANVKATMPNGFGDQDDEDDEDDQDDTDDQDEAGSKGSSGDEDTMSIEDMFGDTDDEDETDTDDEDETDTDDEAGGGAMAQLDPDQLDALIDAALGVSGDEDDEDGENETYSALSAGAGTVAGVKAQAKAQAQRKAAAVKAKRQAATKVLQALEEQYKGVRLPAQQKKLLAQAAMREVMAQAKSLARQKALAQTAKQKQAAQSERKTAQAMRDLVQSEVQELLVNTRPMGRSFGFGGYAAGNGGSVERGTKTFDRSRMGSVNRLSGQYRRGTPEFKLIDLYRSIVNPHTAGSYFKEFKALGGSVAGSGGYIVPDEWSREFIDLLRTKAVVRKFARIYPMSSDTLHLPRQTGQASAAWAGENVDITSLSNTDAAFDEIVFTAKNLVAFAKTSNQLLSDSTYDAENIVREDLRKVVALKEDNSFLIGAAASGVPTSIYESIPAGNKLVGSDTGQAMRAEDVYTLMNAVEENNGQVDTFITSPTGLMRIRKLKDTTGNFIFSSAGGVNAPQVVMEAPHGADPQQYGPVGYLMERPVYVTTNLPKVATVASGGITSLTGGTGTLLIAGDSEYAALAQRAQIEIMASKEAGTAFQANQTWFRAILREDFQLTMPGTFAVLGFN